MKIVVKFGGSSLASAEQFKKVADIIHADPHRRFVVPSAPGKRFDGDTKVTDMLYGCYDLAEAGKDFDGALADIKARYDEIIEGLGLDLILDKEFETIHEQFRLKAGRNYAASRGEYLEKLGYELTYLDVDAYGVIDLAQLREVLREDTTLVSVMTGNNEIGTIEPLDAVASMLRGTGTLFHTDAVQAIGQIPLSMNQLPVDYLSASAHKFHGPKGVGFLFVRKDRDLPSYIHGGSQENGKRAGTENVAGIVGMAKALEIAVEEMQVVRPRIVRLRNYFVERVLREIPQGRLNGHPHKRLPGNVNFSFEGIDATSLLVLLEEDGICASAGSACNTGQTRISHVIEAIHVPKNYAPGSVRFTMGRETDRRQVDAVIASLKKNIGLLRGE